MRKKTITSPLGAFRDGTSLGGTVSNYREKQNIYKQGSPATTLFYIQQGAVRLASRSPLQSTAVTAILGVGDFFGELCLAGYPKRMSTAIALAPSSIRTVKKNEMLELLRQDSSISNFMVSYLLSSVKTHRDHVAELLTSTAEKRLARILLRLAHLDKQSAPQREIPVVGHQILAEMVGTTRPRINLFMNKFRKMGYIHYDGGLEVRQSLRRVLRVP